MKTIRVRKEVYERLQARKHEEERFSELLDRLVDRDVGFEDGFGALADVNFEDGLDELDSRAFGTGLSDHADRE